MNLNEIIKHFTHNIVDLNENKWKVIEVSDIEEICKEYHKQQLILSGVSHSRKTGKTLDMVMGIKATIEQGGKAGVAGCKNPQPILDRLKALGIEAKAEPITATQPLKAIYGTNGFQEYISGFTGDEKNQTGFIFYCG